MESLPLEVLFQIAFKLDGDSLISLRLVCRKFSRLHRPPLPNPPSTAQSLPMEIIHAIYGYLGASDFDAARSTCSYWNAAGHRLFIFMEQERLRIGKLTPKELVYIETGDWPKYTPTQFSSLRNLWLADSEGTALRFMQIFVHHVKTLRDTWRCLNLSRTTIDLGEGTTAQWLSPDGRYFFTSDEKGACHVYSLYDPGVYLRAYYNKTKASARSWTPANAYDLDDEGDLTDEEDDIVPMAPPIKPWYAQLAKPFSGQAAKKLAAQKKPSQRFVSDKARYHNVRPIRLASLPKLQIGALVDVGFLDAPNNCFSTQLQIVLLVRTSCSSFNLCCHNLQTSRDAAYDSWKVIQTIHHGLSMNKVDLFSVSPVMVRSIVPDESVSQQAVHISIAGGGVCHNVILPFVQVQEAVTPPSDTHKGTFVVTRAMQPLEAIGSRTYDPKLKLESGEWMVKQARTNVSPETPWDSSFGSQPRSCLFMSPQSKQGGLGASFDENRLFKLETLNLDLGIKQKRAVPPMWNMRYGSDLKVPNNNLWSTLKTLTASNDRLVGCKKHIYGVACPHHDSTIECRWPSQNIQAQDLGWFCGIAIAAVIPVQEREDTPDAKAYITAVKVGPIPLNVQERSLKPTKIIRMCRLDARTTSTAVHFASMTVRGSGTYAAGILQPGNEVWVWRIPYIFNLASVSSSPWPISDHPWTHEDYTMNGDRIDPKTWPTGTPYPLEKGALGRRLGNVRGAKTLRWDWRPRLEGRAHTDIIVGPLGPADLRLKVLRLVIGTTVGKVFTCEFFETGTGQFLFGEAPSSGSSTRWVLSAKGELAKA